MPEIKGEGQMDLNSDNARPSATPKKLDRKVRSDRLVGLLCRSRLTLLFVYLQKLENNPQPWLDRIWTSHTDGVSLLELRFVANVYFVRQLNMPSYTV